MHKSVLKKEVLEYLNPGPNKNFIDATLGLAGHTVSILENNKPKGKVLGIELTPELYKEISALNIERLILVNDSFSNLKEIVRENKFERIFGILFDLGFSNWHLEKSKNGFSFLRDEPLDMRYNENLTELTAEIILNKFSQEDIKNILKEYGQEQFSSGISRRIVEERERRPIKTTFQLVEIIKTAVPPWYQHKRIHFATRSFQALRIRVNDELKNIEQTLPQALEVLEKGGRLVIISFHSLEDRIIKNYFREKHKKGLVKILTKKPIRPSQTEVISNPRSRSAKLRAVEKIYDKSV
jgi:16S rRNA (cytosine1402-N4)-methyltransferase